MLWQVSWNALEDRQMKPLHEIQAADLESCSLQHEIDTSGHLLIRNLLPQHALNKVLGDITRILYSARWLVRDDDPLDRIADIGAACGDPDPFYTRIYEIVFNLESFHALPHHPALKKVMNNLIGENILIHPKPNGRLIFPRCERLVNHDHHDFRIMNGHPACFTAWIPLHDCPTRVGPSQILDGPHCVGIRSDDEAKLQFPELPEGAARGGDWAGGDVSAGDVLIFHSLATHTVSPNLSNQMHISMDCRFQDYRRVVNPATLAFAGESAHSWERTYSGWRSDGLKYYWKKLPLRLDPSMAELERLAKTADSPRKQARYVRILSQLEEFVEFAGR
jgi:hypothetical protein